MKKNKKRNRIMLLLILLLGITVGFAALATTLKINGNASITKNNWSVYWDEDSIAVTQGSKGDTMPGVVNGEDGSVNTKVNWNVNLEVPGDFYEFTIDATNNGTIIIISISHIHNAANSIFVPLPIFICSTSIGRNINTLIRNIGILIINAIIPNELLFLSIINYCLLNIYNYLFG